MRLLYIVICSAIFLAFMGGLHWLMTGMNEMFGIGVAVGFIIAMPLGYYAGRVDEKRKDLNADPYE